MLDDVVSMMALTQSYQPMAMGSVVMGRPDNRTFTMF
jgi:hypothetical protein